MSSSTAPDADSDVDMPLASSREVGEDALSANRDAEARRLATLLHEYSAELRAVFFLARSREFRGRLLTAVFALFSVVTLGIAFEADLLWGIKVGCAAIVSLLSVAILMLRNSVRFYRDQLEVPARILERLVRRASEVHENVMLTSPEELELGVRLSEAEAVLALASRFRLSDDDARSLL